MTDRSGAGVVRLSGVLAGGGRWSVTAADVRRVREVWGELGIHCSSFALRFVEEFEGSGFAYPRHPLDPGAHRCELDAERVSRIVRGEELRAYEQRAGRRLAPVGTAASGPLVLLVGESPEEALVRLLDRVRPVRLK